MIKHICKFAVLLTIVFAAISPAAAQLIIGHRGASFDAPENTPASFRLALKDGADGFETDFYLSSDGQLACFHDPDTERVGGVKHVIKDTPLAVLRSLDVGAWKGPRFKGEHIGTFEEIVALVPAGKCIYIELKIGPEIVKPVLAALDASSLKPEQAIIISFQADTIAEVEKLRPNLKSYWLVKYKQDDAGAWSPTVDDVIATLKRIKADGLDSQAEMKYVNGDFVKKLHAAGSFDFQVWTIDDVKVAQYYQKLGATAITTNRPGWLRKQLQSATAAPAPPVANPIPLAVPADR